MPSTLHQYARRDAETFLAAHPLPQDPLPLPDLTPFLTALSAAETPAEVSVITRHLAGATAPLLDHIAGHIIGVALWAGQEHQHTPRARRLLREAARDIRTALVKVAEADLENLRAQYPAGAEAPTRDSSPASRRRAEPPEVVAAPTARAASARQGTSR
ncbi:hypothetical protein ACFVP0_09950 [Streptomyces cinereoruber]|uniref:hypothetical protein n=1 Tax=Streptomyces cinereoruber TaxID=67260 RepID=UPI0036CCE867